MRVKFFFPRAKVMSANTVCYFRRRQTRAGKIMFWFEISSSKYFHEKGKWHVRSSFSVLEKVARPARAGPVTTKNLPEWVFDIVSSLRSHVHETLLWTVVGQLVSNIKTSSPPEHDFLAYTQISRLHRAVWISARSFSAIRFVVFVAEFPSKISTHAFLCVRTSRKMY